MFYLILDTVSQDRLTKEIQLDIKIYKRNKVPPSWSWVFIGRTDVEAETPILWPPDVKSWIIWKDPDSGKDWGQEKKRTTENEMVGMASLIQWAWVWVDSSSWWWIGRPGVLRFMGSQRVRHDWATELNWMMKTGFRSQSPWMWTLYCSYSGFVYISPYT